MENMINTYDIYHQLLKGALNQFFTAEDELEKVTHDATPDNKVQVGSYSIGNKYKRTNDIGATLMIASMAFDRIVKIEEELKSIKKLIKSKREK